ncbi:hypothetical protein MANES_12G104900v8 [Manihot esculenta]|uniref:Uncharacterized protein n=1 Tax=Manihot esculenta TaxID=3983 RepID=A0A2C9UVG3_MANES|nr:hypothetical protein MANES_12G104900v8 [Manihot esculenta]
MASCHIRSFSLPSRSHPLIVTIEEQLCKLKASQFSTMSCKLNGLKNLFECTDDLLQMPVAQQTLSHESQSQCVEDALSGSLDLLDLCDSIRDFFSQMKECVQELEFSLGRRKRGITSEVEVYMESRKKLSKVIIKYLRYLKRKERNSTSEAMDNNSNLTNMISILTRVQEISLGEFQSILSFISQPKAKSKPFGWSIISKALQSKRVSCEVETEVNEVEKLDAELLTLKSSKDISISQLQSLLKGLEALGSSIQEAEEELECIYRLLVKTRVSLLNILNH